MRTSNKRRWVGTALVLPALEAGMDQFQEAYQELALHEVIGR